MDRHIQPLLETQRFQVVRIKHRSSDGVEHTRDMMQHPGAVTVIPMVDEQHVCLIRNFRIGVNQTLIELPAGTLEAGEDPGQCARRELVEETGFRAETINRLHSFYMSPGVMDERMHLFAASDLEEGSAAREPGEFIENLVIPWSQAIEMIHDGEIQDAKTIVGLLYYDRILNML